MMDINLLNWREKNRFVQNNRFYLVIGVAVLCSVLLSLFISLIIEAVINSSKGDLDYITAQTAALGGTISKVEDIQAQEKLFLSRREVIESLQDNRSLTVKIFDNIPRIIPTGVVLTEMSRKGNELTLTGEGDTNSAISAFLENVQRLRWIKDAKLAEIKSIEKKQEGTTTTAKKVNTKSRSNSTSAAPEVKKTVLTFAIKANIDAPDEHKSKDAGAAAAVPNAASHAPVGKAPPHPGGKP